MSDNPTQKKWANKYLSPEEMEKGYMNLTQEIARVKEEGAKTAAQAEAYKQYSTQLEGALSKVTTTAPTAPARAQLVDDEGRLDESALLGLINQQLKPLQDQVSKMPEVIESTLGQILAPVAKQSQASAAFWGREDVEKAKFSQAEMARFLGANDGVRKTYETLLKNPDTAEEAYTYAFTTWSATRPTPVSAIDERKKASAGQPTVSAGPPAQTPEEEGSWKRIRELESVAADTRDPAAVTAALQERFKGTKLMEDLERYAEEHGLKP